MSEPSEARLRRSREEKAFLMLSGPSEQMLREADLTLVALVTDFDKQAIYNVKHPHSCRVVSLSSAQSSLSLF
jgi:hypothetical protein